MLESDAPPPDHLLARAHALLGAAEGAEEAVRPQLADEVGRLARRLAPDDVPPAEGPGAAAWRALVAAADRLYGAGLHAMGRLPFLTEPLLAMLRDEAARLRPASTRAGRATARAGDALARLAASRQLREAASAALGFAAAPTLDALYEYDGPGARVATHVDADGWGVVFHLLLAHDGPGGPGISELVAHLPGRDAPARVRLAPGEGVVLRGRGTLHAWSPLGPADHRTLAAVGFARVG